MANAKISELTDLAAAPAAGDFFVVVDISEGVTGTTKKVAFSNVHGDFVTLDTTQTITGAKTLTAVTAISGDLSLNQTSILSGDFLRLLNPANSGFVDLSLDAVTDFNIAASSVTDLNLTGFIALNAGTVDADFDALTATSFGGILEANLLDKTAAETISAAWDFAAITATNIALLDNIQIEFGTGADWTFAYNGTNFIADNAGALGAFQFSGGPVHIRGGDPFAIFDSTNNNLVVFTNTGTELVITETGMAAIQFGAASLSLDVNDNPLLAPVITDYSIESETLTVTANAVTVTFANGPVAEIDLEAATGAVIITLSGGPPTGTYGQVTLKIQQDGTAARTISFAGGTFVFVDGTQHPITTTLNGFSLYTFETWDGGSIWHGAGADYS